MNKHWWPNVKIRAFQPPGSQLCVPPVSRHFLFPHCPGIYSALDPSKNVKLSITGEIALTIVGLH